jgi:membrane-bound metal-dependent hydrolase YbcI (DUF457 family)
MRTYSHLLVTAVLARPLKRRGISVHTPAFLTGSVLPDIPFALLTAIYGLRYQWQQDISWQRTHVLLHDIHFFKDPVWVIGHNLFHAPLILLAIGLLGYWLHRRGWAWGKRIFWLAAGAGLHTAVDTLTHYDDGPLLLFPFD